MEIIDREYYERRVRELSDALEHATGLLVDTWSTAMDGDPEKEWAVSTARQLLASAEIQTGNSVGNEE